MSFTLLVAITILLAIISQQYCIRRVIKTIKQLFPSLYGRKTKIAISVFLIIFNVYFILFILFWLRIVFAAGSDSILQNTTFDFLVAYPTFMIFLMMLQIGLFLLLFDLIKLVLLPLYTNNKERWKTLEAKAVLALVVFFMIYVPARIIYDYNVFPVSTVEYKKQSLPAGMDNFKITFISDIHADNFTDGKRLGRFIDKVNSTHPDLVLIAGDLISRGPSFIPMSAEYIARIKSRFGIFTCVGDHDFWSYRSDPEKSLDTIKRALGKYNIPMVDNENMLLKINSANVLISFVTNTYVSRIDRETLQRLTRGSDDNRDLKIFLVHQPTNNLISAALLSHYDLFLAGHTHGGQITFLFPFMNLTPTLIETKYVKGSFRFGNMLMYVTRGLGMSVLPLRYNSTPEIVSLTLKK